MMTLASASLIDGPEVEPSACAGGDVARQVVDVVGRKRRIMPRRLADESGTRQIPNDCLTVPQARHRDLSG